MASDQTLVHWKGQYSYAPCVREILFGALKFTGNKFITSDRAQITCQVCAERFDKKQLSLARREA